MSAIALVSDAHSMCRHGWLLVLFFGAVTGRFGDFRIYPGPDSRCHSRERRCISSPEKTPAIDAEELIDRMQTVSGPPQTTPPRRLKKAWLLAAAVLAAVAAIGTPMWLFGGEGPEDAASEPEAVFSWGEDIRKWVTAEELKAVLESATEHWEGAALSGGKVVFDDEVEWTYQFASYAERPWGAWSGSFQEFDWEAEGFPDSSRTDQRLPDGVVFWGLWGDSAYRGPNSSEAIAIGLHAPYSLYPLPESDVSSEEKDDMYFEVVSMVLRELGWAD